MSELRECPFCERPYDKDGLCGCRGNNLGFSPPALLRCPYGCTGHSLTVNVDDFGLWYVHCCPCDADGPRTKEWNKAIELWNTRKGASE